LAVTTTQAVVAGPTPGYKAKKLRNEFALTRPALAVMAGVTAEEVSLFERGLPVRLDAKRRILKVLWAKKTEK
jgi:DNA-binding transcriptional regulator YiaG